MTSLDVCKKHFHFMAFPSPISSIRTGWWSAILSGRRSGIHRKRSSSCGITSASALPHHRLDRAVEAWRVRRRYQERPGRREESGGGKEWVSECRSRVAQVLEKQQRKVKR